jgi:Periplasmic component of the Tol biopolymer transport system
MVIDKFRWYSYIRLMKQLFTLFFTLSVLFCSAQPATEIFLFDIKVTNGQVTLSNAKNISKHKGYDNQPFFHPDQPVIYYSSFDDSSRSDIKFYNYQTKQTSNLTLTREREYSPTVTPDGNFVSCIVQRDNGAQDLAKYPINGGKPEILINHLKVGYHAWADDNKLFLFVLDDSINNSLHHYYLDKNADTVIAENIGRSLHKIPGQNAMSFVQKISDKQYVVKKYDLNTGVISSIIAALPGQDQLCWLKDNIALMSDGTKLFSFRENSFTELKDRKWQPVIIQGDTSMLKGITRLAVNVENTKLAMVVNE